MPIWKIEGGMQGDGSDEATVEQLNLGRDVAANCPSGNSPPNRPPLQKRGGHHLHRQIGASLHKNMVDRTG